MASEDEAQAAFEYILNEVERDALLSHQEQQDKVQEFKNFADQLSPRAALKLKDLLLHETRCRIVDMLQQSGLDSLKIEKCLADYNKTVLKVKCGRRPPAAFLCGRT